MPNLLNLLIFPMTVAILALVIEYWIILPIKEFTAKKKLEITSPLKNPYVLELILRLIILSGAITFFLIVIIAYGSLNETSSPTYKDIERFKNSLPEFVGNIITDANIMFAAIVYTCLVLNFSVIKSDVRSNWSVIFTGVITPPILLLLWAIVFFRDSWLYFLICLVVSNLWVFWLYATGHSESVTIVSLFLFPANALILIKVVGYMPIWGWVCALMILLLVIAIVGMIKSANQTQDENYEDYQHLDIVEAVESPLVVEMLENIPLSDDDTE
jgi:hypothetical protein